MSLRDFLCVGAIGLVLANTLQPAFAGDRPPPGVLARSGGNFEQREHDKAACKEIASDAPIDDLPQTGDRAIATGYASDIPTAIGGSIAFALLLLIDIGQARGKAQAYCMVNMGYVSVPLTEDEAKAFRKVKQPARLEWEKQFLTQDLEARIAAVRTPAVPPLPAYRAMPDTIGGLKIDVASLARRDGEIAVGGVAITGKAERARTAVLSTPIATPEGQVQVTGEPGAVFHLVDYRPQRAALLRNQGSTWCGPVTQTAASSPPAPATYCFTSTPDGYNVFRPSGFAWLAGPYRDGFVLPQYHNPIVLEERDQDDLGPFELEITIADLTRSRIEVEARAVRDGKRVLVMKRELKFDGDGKATLPLWSRRAVFTRPAKERDEVETRSTPKLVTVSLDDQGDGHSWRDGEDVP